HRLLMRFPVKRLCGNASEHFTRGLSFLLDLLDKSLIDRHRKPPLHLAFVGGWAVHRGNGNVILAKVYRELPAVMDDMVQHHRTHHSYLWHREICHVAILKRPRL